MFVDTPENTHCVAGLRDMRRELSAENDGTTTRNELPWQPKAPAFGAEATAPEMRKNRCDCLQKASQGSFGFRGFGCRV